MAKRTEAKWELPEQRPQDEPEALTFSIHRPCIAGDVTYKPGDEQALLDAELHPGTIKMFILTGAIVGNVPGITIDEEDRTRLFSPAIKSGE